MPEIVVCPNCERKLKLPDKLLGKRVKCPNCQEPFQAAAPGKQRTPQGSAKKTPPRPGIEEDEDGPVRYEVAGEEKGEEEDEKGKGKRGILEAHFRDQQIEDERGRRGKRPFADNWRKARLGVRIVSIAALILVTNFIVQLAGRGIIFVITLPDSLEPTPNDNQKKAYEQRVQQAESERKESRRYLVSAVAIVYLVAQLTALIGIGICLMSPDKDNMRLLIAGTLVLAVASLGLEIGCSIAPLQYLTSGALDAQGNVPPVHPGLKIATDLVGYLRFFVFLFFMRVIAKNTKIDELGREVLYLIFFMPAMIVFWVVMAILTAVKLPVSLASGLSVGAVVIEGNLLAVIGTGSLALVLASVVWFSMTLHSTAVAISDWLRER